MSIIRKTPISTLFPYTTLFRSFRQIKRLVARSKNFYTVFFQLLRQLQCGLSAQLNDHPFRLFMENYFINMFPKNRLKIKFISNIEICGNGFGITIDHDGFIATFLGSKDSMNTRVIEFYALSYAVWPRT